MLLFLFACADKVDPPADEPDCREGTWYPDADGDGHGNADVSTLACDAPEGHVAVGDDCDDSDAAVSPDADEVCGGGDEDCSGEVDDDAVDASDWYRDSDGDGYGGQADIRACDQPGGYIAQGGDCHDGYDSFYPGAPETPESRADTNCDGFVTCYADADGDGFAGDGTTPSEDLYCDDSGEAHHSSDCDDTRADTFPGGIEVPYDGVDQDCGGGDWSDVDGDGVDASEVGGADCDDRDATVNPSGTERCDYGDIDDDCDGLVDEADPDLTGSGTFYADADQDGAGDPATAVTATCAPDGYVSAGDDCDDADPDTRPLATETCADTVDRNCDGQVGAIDHDGDGVAACEECDDGDTSVFPGAAEVALDGRDDDCDGLVDEATGDVALATDADVAAFCAAYASVEGSLDVSGLANLRDLGCLRAVGGHLRVADVTGPDLRGLEALTDVRGDLLLGGWQSGVGVLAPSGFTALTGLERLRRVGGDAWVAQSEVADLSGAPLLASVGGSFILLDLPLADVSLSLTTLGDDLWLETLPALTSVAAPALTSFGGSLWLQDLAADSGGFTLDWTLPIPGTLGLVLLPAGADAGWSLPDVPGGLHVESTDLTDLGALAHLTRVDGDVLIEDNAALADLAALDGVEEIAGDLGVVSNAGLVSWDDFAGLVRVGGTLRLAGDGPVSANGFGALEEIGEGLVVEEARDLVTIDGFGALATCPDLELSAWALTDASGLAGVPFDGDVSVTYSAALPDVAFLSGVTTLQSLSLTWSGGLTSLAGLEGLGDVAGAVDITDDSALADASLPALVTVGGAITFEDLDRLVTLDLGALQVAGGDVALADLHALSTLDLGELREVGGLWIWGADGLTDLSGLAELTTVEGSLVLEDNDGLLTLGLSSLRTVGGDLQVESHAALLDLGGLDALVSVGNDLTIRYNPALVRPDSLGALAMIGRDLWVEQNAALLDLRGLGDAAVGNTVWLSSNRAMTSLDGLDGVDEVPWHLVLASLPALTDISALASLTLVGGDLHIGSCDALVSLSGLDALAEVGGGLEIGDQVSWGGWGGGLDALVTLDGLGGLRTVGEHLWIGDNAVLVDISALDGLLSVGGELGVVDNPLLPTEDAEALSDGSPVVGGGVTISGNL